MMLCGFLLIASMVLADDTALENDYEKNCKDELECPNGEEDDIAGISSISCFIKSGQLNCWRSTKTLEDTLYSAHYTFCNTEYQMKCSLNSKMEKVECQGKINKSAMVMVQINISMAGDIYPICETYVNANIEVLEPPKVTTALIRSKDLEVMWSQPKAIETKDGHCFDYELKINDETNFIEGHRNHNSTYTKINVDKGRSYSIQMRAKLGSSCANNQHWSDWSETEVVGPFENPYSLNVWVILCIVFVLPMILLTFLLVCKFQRLSEKLFPSVPSPSVKVKMLLEKDEFNEVRAPKHAECENEAEEGTEILQVTS